MADNIIKRIIKLVLDPDSAKKTQDDASAVAQGIENAWKKMAERVAEFLGAAFITEKLLEFGKRAVEEAERAQNAWLNLKGTVDGVGGSFDEMEVKIRATGDAFQDATIHKSEDFAESLTLLIARTGDVKASLNNMGLVANIAAQFFRGDLESAVTLVSKVMEGNVTQLQRMGIHAKNAQEALEILATRSIGAASREAQTFSGQLKQMDNAWADVLESMGTAIITSGGATSAMTVLRAAMQVLGTWIENNKTEISLWVTNGVKFAIDAADVFIRAVTGMASILSGGFMSAIGLASVGVGKLIEGWGYLREIEDNVREKLGQDVTERKKATQAIKDQAAALVEWGKEKFNAGADKIAAGIDRLSTKIFSSEQFSGPPKPPPALVVNPPELAAGSLSKKVEEAIKQYQEAGKQIAAASAVIGEGFDDVTPNFDRTLKLLTALQQEGIDPTKIGLGDLGDKLKFLGTFMDPFNKQLAATAQTMRQDLVVANIQAATSIGPLQARVTQLTDDQRALSEAIKVGVADQKMGTQTFKDLVVEYEEVSDALRAAQFALNIEQTSKALGQDLAFAAITGATALDQLKMKQAALQKEIQDGIKLNQQESASFKDKVKQYHDVTDAIKEQTTVMQLQAAAADFLADALGTAMQGGLHAAAVQKAKQNAVEAAEMLVRAGAFALFGDFPQAGAALVLAGQFAGIAAAWGAIAATTHGSSSGGSSGVTVPTSGSAGATAPGSDLTSSRASSSNSSSQAQQPSAEVSVYLVGPGFNALNPAVQRVVYGAQQEAIQRYGPNARIRVRSSESGS